jgi:hypothetical protein
MNTTCTPTANRFISPGFVPTSSAARMGVMQLPHVLAARYIPGIPRVEGRRHRAGFLLSDAEGRLHYSEQLRRRGLVVSFLRGGCSAGLGTKVMKGELRMATNSSGRGAYITVAWPGEA